MTNSRGAILAAILLSAGFGAAWLPTLHHAEFSNSIENIVVETVLETRRGSHWLIPRMLDEPRTRKPPLATWASALSTRPQTVRQLSDPATREAAYVRLAREVRLPALIAACLTILAAGELGRVLGGGAVGLAAALITATSLLFLEYARQATPDTHLALWVTCCNVMLAHAIFRDRCWLGLCGAGVCLGLAVMSKGPVALIQTVVPAVVLVVLSARGEARRRWIAPALAGVMMFLCVALPWPLLMIAEVPGVWRTWVYEVTRLDPADPKPDRWYANVQLVRHLLPWTPWFLAGAWAAGRSVWRRRGEPWELAFWLVVVPLVVMSFFSERKPRYLLPLVPAAAVLAAGAVVHMLNHLRPRRTARAAMISLFAVLAGGMLIFDVFRPRGRSDMKPLADAIAVAVAEDCPVCSYWEDDPANNAPLDLSIHLNRVVAPVKSIEDVPTGAVVVLGRPATSGVSERPAWTYLGSASRGTVAWHAFVTSAGAAE